MEVSFRMHKHDRLFLRSGQFLPGSVKETGRQGPFVLLTAEATGDQFQIFRATHQAADEGYYLSAPTATPQWGKLELFRGCGEWVCVIPA